MSISQKIANAIEVLAGAMLLGLCDCSGSTEFESKMVALIQKCSDMANCRIQLSDVTTFDWDRLYAFKYTATEENRNQALEIKDEGFTEFLRQLVFVKDGKIVFQESQPTNVEGLIKNEVVFDIPDDSSFKSYPHEVMFSVVEMSGKAGPYYLLKQVQ